MSSSSYSKFSHYGSLYIWFCMIGTYHLRVNSYRPQPLSLGHPWRMVAKVNLCSEQSLYTHHEYFLLILLWVCLYIYIYIKEISVFYSLPFCLTVTSLQDPTIWHTKQNTLIPSPENEVNSSSGVHSSFDITQFKYYDVKLILKYWHKVSTSMLHDKRVRE